MHQPLKHPSERKPSMQSPKDVSCREHIGLVTPCVSLADYILVGTYMSVVPENYRAPCHSSDQTTMPSKLAFGL